MLVFWGCFVFTVFYWSFSAIGVALLRIFTSFFMDPQAHRDLGQYMLGLLFKGYIGALLSVGVIEVDAAALEEFVDVEGPIIFASNHPAMWDAPLLIRRFGKVSCIMKAELLENPFLRRGAQFAGFLPNAPRLTMIRKSIERLRERGRLLMFPEGTRTREGNRPVNDFKPGLALLAQKSGAPVLPIFIFCDSPYLQKGWPIWRMMPRVPVRLLIEVGELQTIQPGERARDFSERLEKYFRAELEVRDPFPVSEKTQEVR